jgi:chemotaxis signal transduction protein
MQVLSFRNGKETYCVKVSEVSEVLNQVDVVALPRAPELFDGIFQLRGRVIGLFNLQKLLQAESLTGDSQILVLAEPHNQLAVRIPGNIESHLLNEDAMDLREAEAGQGDLLEGIVYDGEEIYHILSLAKVFSHAQLLITQSDAGKVIEGDKR